MGLGSLFRSSYELLSLKYIIHNSSAGAVADEPILRLLLHLLVVFKTFVVLFINSALFCLVDCALSQHNTIPSIACYTPSPIQARLAQYTQVSMLYLSQYNLLRCTWANIRSTLIPDTQADMVYSG